MTEFRLKIKEELKKRKWTATKLAEETGIRYASITNYLSGKRQISSSNLEIIWNKLELF